MLKPTEDQRIPTREEDSPREDQHQYIKGEARRGCWCVCKGGLFYSRGNGGIHAVQTNRDITGDVLIEISDETIPVMIRHTYRHTYTEITYKYIINIDCIVLHLQDGTKICKMGLIKAGPISEGLE